MHRWGRFEVIRPFRRRHTYGRTPPETTDPLSLLPGQLTALPTLTSNHICLLPATSTSEHIRPSTCRLALSLPCPHALPHGWIRSGALAAQKERTPVKSARARLCRHVVSTPSHFWPQQCQATALKSCAPKAELKIIAYGAALKSGQRNCEIHPGDTGRGLACSHYPPSVARAGCQLLSLSTAAANRPSQPTPVRHTNSGPSIGFPLSVGRDLAPRKGGRRVPPDR